MPASYALAFQYDALGRLLVADHSVDNGHDVGVGDAISYDANGNVLDMRIGA